MQHLRRDAVGRRLTRRIPVGSPDDSISSVLQGFRTHHYDTLQSSYIYVTNQNNELQGVVRASDLLASKETQTLREIMESPSIRVQWDLDQEHAAEQAIQVGISEVPVIDRSGYFLGAIPAQSLLEILQQEHVEDLHRLAGVRRESSSARRAIEEPASARFRDRIPWLILGLLGSGIATFVVSRFERTLEDEIAVAFFVPAIVYLADAIGTQTETVVVRGINLSHASFWKLLLGEFQAGFLIGAFLGLLAFPMVFIFMNDLRLALAISLAVWMAGTVATTVGLILPWILFKAGKDPAFGSGPIATVIQDILSLMIYFATVQLFMR